MGGGFIYKVDEGARFEGNHTNGTESDPDCAAPLVKMHIHAVPFLIGAGGDTPGSGDSGVKLPLVTGVICQKDFKTSDRFHRRCARAWKNRRWANLRRNLEGPRRAQILLRTFQRMMPITLTRFLH